MMAVYLFGYSIGFISGALAYRWWILGEKKRTLSRKIREERRRVRKERRKQRKYLNKLGKMRKKKRDSIHGSNT